MSYQCHGGSHDDNKGCPGTADNAGFFHFLFGTDGHIADEDMGHTQITESPAEATYDIGDTPPVPFTGG